MIPFQLALHLTYLTDASMSLRHIEALVCFVKSKAKHYVYKFQVNVIFVCF